MNYLKYIFLSLLVIASVYAGLWLYHATMMDMDDMMGGDGRAGGMMGNMMGGSHGSDSGMTGKNLSVLEDTNAPEVKPTEVVELRDGDTFDLTASIVKQTVGGRTIKRLAYNGQIPGPVIKVDKGSKVTVNFTNNIDMETALHSHGLRGDWKMDGAVPITPAVGVGETFSYQLEFPDTGVFWYHPHVREDYQQDLGLYGNFIVDEVGYWSEADLEAYLIVDDMLEDGEYDSKVVTKTLMGRFGDRLFINDTEDYNLTVKQGEITRAFITNVANTRTFDLAFAGAKMKLVGGDVGRIEKEVMIDSQIIGTAERYIIELFYDTPGTYEITHRGKAMGTVTVLPSTTNRAADFAVLRTNSADYSDIRARASSLLAKAPDKNLRLDIEMKGVMGDMMQGGGMMGSEQNSNERMGMGGMMMEEEQNDDGIEWEDNMAMMNQMSTDETIKWVLQDTDTGAKNGDIDWSFTAGDQVKIHIKNDENGMHPMQHPIHFHGQRFIVLAKDGVPNDNLQWKDTVLIPAGAEYDILVDMSNPGNWMAHCHIAEHLDAGMMFQFSVTD